MPPEKSHLQQLDHRFHQSVFLSFQKQTLQSALHQFYYLCRFEPHFVRSPTFLMEPLIYVREFIAPLCFGRLITLTLAPPSAIE